MAYLEGREQVMQQIIRDFQREVMDLRKNPRDEYHTMEELYQQRMLWHAMAVRGDSQTSKSLRHHDGELCFGGEYFIVTIRIAYILDCNGCVDCTNCIKCINCTNCTDCTDCIACKECSDCTDCITTEKLS